MSPRYGGFVPQRSKNGDPNLNFEAAGTMPGTVSPSVHSNTDAWNYKSKERFWQIKVLLDASLAYMSLTRVRRAI